MNYVYFYRFCICFVVSLGFFVNVNAQNITTGLKVYWNMDDNPVNSPIIDQTGTYPGTITGTTPASGAGKVNSSLEWVSSQGWAAASGGWNWNPTTTGFTVSFWVNPTSYGTNMTLAGAINGWNAFLFHSDATGGLWVGTDVATRMGTPTNIAAGTLALNQWQHFVFTYSAGTGKLYKNSNLVASKAMTAPVAWSGFFVGSTTTANAIRGKIDEVRLYERALTEADIFNLYAYPSTPAAYTWNGSVGTDWNTAANWTPNGVPSTYDDVVVNSCTTCPKLATTTTVKNLTLNTGAKFDIGTYTLNTLRDLQIRSVNIISNGGTLRSYLFSQLYRATVIRDTVNGISGDITLIHDGTGASGWWGGNVFKGNTTILNHNSYGSAGWINTASNESDIFEKDLVVTNNAYRINFGIAYGSLSVGGNCTFNQNSWDYFTIGGATATFNGNVIVNHSASGGIWISTGLSGKTTFKKGLTLNLKNIGAATYGNSIYIGSNGNGSGTGTRIVQMEGPVVVNNVSTSNSGISPVDIRFGDVATPIRCIFTETASLKVGSDGFRKGNLMLVNSQFQTTAKTILNLSSGATETYTGNLLIGKKTTFVGALEVRTPHIQLSGATFNGTVDITKTGSGSDTSEGGNIFRKQVKITNLAPAGSQINMATVADDIVQQQ
ncbi:LamG domain-containing protein [Xanthocytophaga flava]|uniref:LamG domain-containing protein n=1 Tax=Xanthocytophaga flava TaxID=3048013 RepID=UPI0028D725D5|nr:LamG domain-containing protein [Xanthocytophaga flavus]MDJ1467165.1 LamG domain-containing protein [Xanthocytophaga flavus]